jgi:hypothetical protein
MCASDATFHPHAAKSAQNHLDRAKGRSNWTQELKVKKENGFGSELLQ